MREGLRRAWGERVHRAQQWQRGEEPTPVLEALATAVVWHLVGELDRLDAAERRALVELAPDAIAAARERAGGAGEEAEAAPGDAWREAMALAEAGRALLEGGEPADLRALPGDLERPTPRRVASMLDGRLDGLSAAACALWCLQHDTTEARLLWALDGDGAGARARDGGAPAQDREPILVAAADAEPVRPPGEGTLVAEHAEAEVEAVWFAGDRELAVYAADDAYVGLSAPGLTMRDVRPGYWIGTVDEGVSGELEAELKVGTRTWTWRLPLG